MGSRRVSDEKRDDGVFIRRIPLMCVIFELHRCAMAYQFDEMPSSYHCYALALV